MGGGKHKICKTREIPNSGKKRQNRNFGYEIVILVTKL